MAFKVNRKDLTRELFAAQACVERKNTIPILASVLLDLENGILSLTATDCDVSLKTTLDAEGEAEAFCLPAQQLLNLVTLLDGEFVTFTSKKNERVEVSEGKSKYLLPSDPKDKFPLIDQAKGKKFSVSGQTLKAMLERTLFVVGTDESRWMMMAVKLELTQTWLRAVATDGFRMAMATLPMASGEEAEGLVPRKGCAALQKILADEIVSVILDSNHARFEQGNREITIRLIDGTFPNYKMIIPAERKHSFLFSSDSSTVLKRAGLTASIGAVNNSPQINFEVSKGGIEVTSEDSTKGQGADFVSAECVSLNGSTIKFGVASKQILEVLSVEPQLNWGFDDASSAFRITPVKAKEFEYIYVMMPCRV